MGVFDLSVVAAALRRTCRVGIEASQMDAFNVAGLFTSVRSGTKMSQAVLNHTETGDLPAVVFDT